MSPPTPVYGGWRERRGFGIGSLTGGQTFLGLAGVGVLLIATMVHPDALKILGPPVAVLAGLLLVRVRGESLPGYLARHAGWVVGERRGRHLFSGRSDARLPGPLGGLKPLEVQDPHGSSLAVVWDAQRRTLTALVPLEPTGLDFVDDAEAHDRAAAWGQWLAHLGYLPDLRHVVVTVSSGPVSADAAAQPVPDGLAEIVDSQLAAGVRAGAVRTRTLLSLTIECPRGVEQGCAQMLEVVAAADSLGRCGISVRPAMTLAELSCWIRQCFDAGAGAEQVPAEWADARPVAAREYWDRYLHDASVSAGFFWDECPGETVNPRVLTRLLGPSPYRKRISLVFEPVPAHLAAREVDRQAQAAVFRRQYRSRLGRDETAREQADLERARQTAREQAAGAGLVDVGVYAVVSATDPADLESHVADLVNRAGESRLRLRRSFGTQAMTFMTTLGVGMVPGGGR